MANVFINLPAPAGNGAGAWVDVSVMGGVKDVVVGGGTIGTVNIEISNEAAASSGAPVLSFVLNSDGAAGKQITVASKWMRAVVVGYRGGGVPDINVGADDDGTTIANLAATARSGSGAATDVSAMPLLKTVTVGGTWRGSVVLEYSEDGTDYSPMGVLTRPGQVTAELAAEFMRVTRRGVPQIAPGLPLVDVGATSPGGGSGPGGNLQTFQWVATGGEGSDFFVPLPVARASKSYAVEGSCDGVANIMGFDLPDLTPTDRTTTQFRMITSGAVTSGDQFEFIVVDR